MDALLRFYFNIADPDELSDEKYFKLWGELQFALRFDQQKRGMS